MSYRYTQAVLDGPKSLRCGKLNVMQALAEWANEDGQSWYPISEIASRARLQERAVKYVLQALEAEGFLIIERGHGRGNTSRYQIVLEALCPREIKRAISAEKVQIVEVEKVQIVAENVQKPTENVQLSAEKVQNLSREVNRQEPSNKPPSEPPARDERNEQQQQDRQSGRMGGRDRDDGKIIHLATRQRSAAPSTWLHEGAAIVLGVNELTAGQHDTVLDLYRKYAADRRLTADLVEYAASICTAKNKRDLRYFFGIIGKRLDDPGWVDVATELSNSPYANGKGGENYGKGENETRGQNGTGGGYDRGSGAGIVGVIAAQSRPVNPNFKAALERRLSRNGHG